MAYKSKILISIIKWLAIAIAVAAIVILIRQYCVASYRVSTNSMEEALHVGDYILVDKLPIESNPGRNRIVLFRSPLIRDSINQPLFISRCIGMPGDTINITNEGYVINGRSLPFSPMALNTYFVSVQYIAEFFPLLKKLSIPIRNLETEPFGKTLWLTGFEEYKLREEMPEEMSKQFVKRQITPYKLIVPKKNKAYRITPETLKACQEAIFSQIGNNKAEIKQGKLFVDGKETDFFFFDEDYYWMLSDNTNDAIDSRHVGFIPRSDVIGNVWFRWYGNDKKQIFKLLK